MASKHEQTIQEEEEELSGLSHEFRELIPSLPKQRGWRTRYLSQYQGYWCQAEQAQAIIPFQKHFQAQDTDIILSSIPRSGTIWLKSVVFAIINRKCFTASNHPLLTSDPHVLVPFFDYKIYANNQIPDLSPLPSPRLFTTHFAYPLLAKSIKCMESRIVYMCSNLENNFVSLWHLSTKMRPESLGPLSIGDAYDMYCRGVTPYGPYGDHMLGYWDESLNRPKKALLSKYEEMKGDVILHMKRIAEFLGYPFNLEEEREGC